MAGEKADNSNGHTDKNNMKKCFKFTAILFVDISLPLTDTSPGMEN